MRPRKVLHCMSDLEEKFAATLLTGEPHSCILGDVVRDVKYESVTLHLADGTTYTPDFLITGDEHFTFVEVKGSWSQQGGGESRIKFKVAADKFAHFSFVAAVYNRKAKEFNYEYR